MNFEKLKETARKYEQKEDWRRAIEVYLQAVREFESGQDPVPDISVYNRVGDLYLKANEPGAAVQAYERAVDLYGDQGFYNNAIALCGKILRVAPGRTQAYLKLAHLQARKNVVIEAKKNLLEYLDRMHTQGQLDEAFKAVTAFADQYPSNKEIRLMLSELLRASSRNAEAREQLERLASDLEARGDTIGARKTLLRLHAMDLDPGTEAPPKQGSKRSNDLVFLDTGPPTAIPATARTSSRSSRKTVAQPKAATAAGLTFIDVPAPAEPLAIETSSIGSEPIALESVQPISEEAHLEATAHGEVAKALGFEATSVEPEASAEVAPLDGLEIDRPDRESLELSSAESVLGIEHEQATEEAVLESSPSADLLTGDTLAAPDFDVGPMPGIELGNQLEGFSEAEFEVEPSDELMAIEVPAGQESEEVTFLELGTAEETGPTIEQLEERVLDDPDDPDTHWQLGEALLGVGEQARGQEELELALTGYEGREEWARAEDVIAALVRVDPNAVRFHQKRVEVAFRTGDRAHLIDAYTELGDALLRVGAMDKALAVYRRVLEHDPDNARVQAALEVLAPTEIPPEPAEPPAEAAPALEPLPPRSSVQAPAPVPPVRPPETPDVAPPAVAAAPPPAPLSPKAPEAAKAPPADTGDFIDLGALILEEERIRDTRMKADVEAPTGDEQRDFQDMLTQFKRGIEENIDSEDFQSHYDLGVAFKEMGLLDESIAEFQKALRAPEGRLKTSEALGTAFFEKGQFAIAEAILRRAVESLGATDDAQIGLIYWLGRSQEAQGNSAAAVTSYQRVLAVDIGFQDASSRMARLSREAAR